MRRINSLSLPQLHLLFLLATIMIIIKNEYSKIICSNNLTCLDVIYKFSKDIGRYRKHDPPAGLSRNTVAERVHSN